MQIFYGHCVFMSLFFEMYPVCHGFKAQRTSNLNREMLSELQISTERHGERLLTLYSCYFLTVPGAQLNRKTMDSLFSSDKGLRACTQNHRTIDWKGPLEAICSKILDQSRVYFILRSVCSGPCPVRFRTFLRTYIPQSLGATSPGV